MPAPNHVQGLVEERLRRVRRDLQLDLRSVDPKLVVFLENDGRQLVDLALAVLLRPAKVNGLSPVVVDGRPLHQEVVDEFTELGLGVAALRLVPRVVGVERAIEVAEGPHLEAVDVFTEHEVEVDELQDLICVRGGAAKESVQAVGAGQHACIAVRMGQGIRLEPLQHLENRTIRDVDSVEVGLRLRRHLTAGLAFPPITPGTLADAGKPKCEKGVPVRDGVVEVLPHDRRAGRVLRVE